MNKVFTFIICILTLTSSAQITIMLYPAQGLELKPSDVFKATVQSQDNGAAKYYFVGTITNLTTGEKMVSSKSMVVDILPGATTLSESVLAPDYQITSTVVSQNGVFPYGNYKVCLAAYKLNVIEPVSEDCREMEITPMSPPLLLSPENQSSITTETPLLVWLPPMPVMKDQVLYNLKLVEMLPNQTAYDAIQRNFGLLEQQNITGTTLQYPMNAAKLEDGKKYAWKIVAKAQDGKPIGETEVWWFMMNRSAEESLGTDPITRNFVKLKTHLDSYYVTVKDELKILYQEDYLPSNVNMRIKDPKGNIVSEFVMHTKSVGENPFVIKLTEIGKLKYNAFYVVEATVKGRASQFLMFKITK